MKVTAKSRRMVRLQNIMFVVLFLSVISLIAWLSTRYHYQSDWTANGRNTLSQASVSLLAEIEEPLKVMAFTADSGALKNHISDLVARYQRYKKDLQLEFVNPDTDPARVRELGVTIDGMLVFEYQGRYEKAAGLDEQSITNALQRLSRSGERWLVFLEGHGERSPFGQANHDLQTWAQQLEAKGFRLKGINLATSHVIPDNTSVLVLAGPQVNYLPGEVRLIEDYIFRGGNLLWLAEPEGLFGLESLAERLGVEFEPGVIVDPTTQMFAIDNPTFAIVGDYGFNPLTRDFDMLTIFPRAAGLNIETQDEWQGETFLTTTAQSWSETGVLAGEIEFDENEDIPGPLTIGVSATRLHSQTEGDGSQPEHQQRVVVVGDGDFLSNAYLGNGGNLDLGMNMVNWLSSDDQLIAIPAKTAIDTSLNLSQTQSIVIGFVFLVLLPFLLLASGLFIWLRRRKA